MLQKEKKQKEKKLSPKEILDDAFDFATKYPNDPMVLSCHCSCVNCEHDIQEAIDKLNKVLKINEGYEYDVLFEPDFTLTEN